MATIERLGSPRILKGTAGTLEIVVYSDGVPTDPTSPSVSVVDDTGASVTVGSATAAGDGSGRVTATIAPAQTATVNNLTATWTLTVGGAAQTFVTYHKIVGDVLFALVELRGFDDAALRDVGKYPDTDLYQMRELVTEAFEEILPFSLGTQFRREVVNGNNLSPLFVSRRRVTAVRAAASRVTTTWTAFTGDQLTDLLIDERGRITRDTDVWPLGVRNVRLDYEHGAQPIPQEIRRAGIAVARKHLIPSQLPTNAISQVDGLGTFRLSVPGQRGSWFGLPDVDRVLRTYVDGYSVPGIG